MTQAVRNERLAVRQKLIDIYQEKAKPLIENLQQSRLKFEQRIQQIDQVSHFSFFVEFCCDKEYAEGLVIYDNNGQIIFPVLSKKKYYLSISNFEEGWKSEFIDNDYIKAAKEYEQKIMDSSIPYEVFHGRLAMIRCYEKAANIEEAVNLCRKLAYPGEHIVNEYTSSDIIRARLKLVQLYQKQNTSIFEKETALLLSNLIGNTKKEPLPSEVRVFVLSELLKLIDNSQLPQPQQESIAKAQKILKAETLSLQVLGNLLKQAAWDKWQERRLKTIDSDEKIYGMLFKTENRKVILVCQRSSIVNALKYIAEKLSDSTSAVSVFDEHNNPVFGENQNAGKAFLTIRPGDFWGEWKLCFFFHDSKVFDQAANKQAAIYTWTGVLVVLLIFGSGAIAAQVVGRQMKLNRLKNDFIATVTHELKTPLSSMRVLVDTLLEGNYNDQQQATEYLHLISKENVRLSHLIDHFLTFSRMERNKQAFDMAKTDPAEIAKSAAEAVQTKFNHENCKFTVTINEGLTPVLADKDAMVTVMVNLLDNAYKYSYDEKQIQLEVFGEEDFICFEVKDNGTGMTRRQIKKIFDRFYQTDSSLSRQAEGAGLGLSIVKFIVDAHHGSITVDSRPGKGSTFTVILPQRKNQTQETLS
jgi:signal transduction histidine kinase